MSPITLFLLRLFGPILLIIGLSLFINKDHYRKMLVKEFKEFTLSFFLIALLPFCTGLVIVLAHNKWATLPEVLVSIIGWGALLKGIVRLLMPEWCWKVVPKFAASPYLEWSAFLIIVWGAYMSWVGYLV